MSPILKYVNLKSMIEFQRDGKNWIDTVIETVNSDKTITVGMPQVF